MIMILGREPTKFECNPPLRPQEQPGSPASAHQPRTALRPVTARGSLRRRVVPMRGRPSSSMTMFLGADDPKRGIRALWRARTIGQTEIGQGEPGRVLVLGQYERSAPRLGLPPVLQGRS